MNPISNIEQLRELAWAFRASRVLQVASKLEVFTILSQGPLTAREVAEHCESNPEMTEKLLIACTAIGLTRFEGGRYRNSDLADLYLIRGKPFYQGNWIDHASDLWDEWSNLERWIGGKKTSRKRGNGHRRFIMAMHDIAMGGEAEELASHMELKDGRLLFDVGGGPGTYSIILCKHNPQLRAVVFDLPETIPITREVIEKFGMSDRISILKGNWNKDDFGQGNDVVLMSNVLHGPGSQARMKLRKAFKSMTDGGLLIIRDFFLNETKTGPLSAALFNLMVGAYSIKEITSLIRNSEFVNIRELQIPHKTHSILLAEKH
ncbi:MAG: methyltransferase dimerization domain-containing protein [Candidatus Bathyarchaeia archaeon]